MRMLCYMQRAGAQRAAQRLRPGAAPQPPCTLLHRRCAAALPRRAPREWYRQAARQRPLAGTQLLLLHCLTIAAFGAAALLQPPHRKSQPIALPPSCSLQVAVFDTTFHQSMPAEAYTYALPLELAAMHRIRRYGDPCPPP